MEASASKRIKVYNTKPISNILDGTLESFKHLYPEMIEWKFRKHRQSDKILTSIKKKKKNSSFRYKRSKTGRPSLNEEKKVP